MRGDERQPTLSSTAAWLKSLTSTVVQNATDSTDRRVFSDCCCERRGLVDQSATRASGGAIATPAHRACARTHSQSPATDGRYGFLSLGAAHRVASADESLLAKACVRSTSSGSLSVLPQQLQAATADDSDSGFGLGHGGLQSGPGKRGYRD